MKKAFTLAEMLVCLALISAVVVIFISTIKARPNSNMVMFRKAYNIASNSVYEMMQSPVNYSTGELTNTAPTEVTYDDEKPSGTSKFCKVFAHYVNTGEYQPACSGDGPHFTTMDGIDWYMPITNFAGGSATIKVDVNGRDNLPNCKPDDAGCTNPDIFEIRIDKEGKLSVPNDIARSYLQNSRKISK